MRPAVPAIRTLAELAADERDRALAAIREIFFLSSVSGGTLLGPAREAFWRRWTGYYIAREPEFVLLALVGDVAAGYLMGSADTLGAAQLAEDLPYYRAFADCYRAYPAHFHVNVHPDWRGRGIGAVVVGEFRRRVAAAGACGAHVVTAAAARNRAFYERLGFAAVATRCVGDHDLVLLARGWSQEERA